MVKTTLVSTIRDYISKAVPIARSGRATGASAAAVKSDETYVTEIDMSLSRLALELFSPIVGSDSVVTEEHSEALQKIKGENGGTRSASRTPAAATDEYLVVVDPIDGTRNYVHGIPLYGISVGVLHNRRPWIGALAFPGLNEVLLCDCDGAYHGRLTPDGAVSDTLQRIGPQAAAFDRNAVVLTSQELFGEYSWAWSAAGLMTVGCATVELAWAALGRGVAAFFGAHIWDLAGAWPILQAVGLELIRVESRRPITFFTVDDYHSESDLLKEWSVVCRPEHVSAISQALRRVP